MEITLNGEKVKLNTDSNISDLVVKYQLSAEQVAVELNRKIIVMEDFVKTKLKQGDEIELIEFVGGG
jgi:sulfur carrier protein